MRRTTIAAALLAPLALACGQARAQGAAEKELKAVVVGVSRAQTKLEDMPLSTTLLTRADIEASPAISVDQLLKNIPGVNLTDAPAYVQHPTGQSISMRGLGNARTLVLLDGIPLSDAFYGTIQWHKVPMSSIERVEVVKGAASSLWGNMAMGGVINIVTRRPEAGAGHASASYGTFNTSTVAGDVGVAAADAVKLRIFADNFLTGGYDNVPAAQRLSGAYAAGVGNGSHTRNSNVGATAYFEPGGDTSGHLRFGLHEMHEQSNGNDVAPNNQRNADLALGLTRKLGGDAQLQAAAWYQDTKFDTISGAYKPATWVQNYYDNPYDDLGASLVWSDAFKTQASEVQAGVDYRRVSGSNKTFNYPVTAGVLTSTNFGDGTHTFVGVFGQWKWLPKDMPVDVTLSARYDRWKNEGTTVNQPVPGVATSANFDTSQGNFDPSLTLRYLASDAVTLRAAAYRAFHAPGLNNMYRTYGSSSVTFSNPSLMPETMTGYEAGLDFQARELSAKLTAFKNDVKDLITTYTLAAGSALENSLCGGTPTALLAGGVCPAGSQGKNKYYKNAGEAVMQGAEAEVRYAFTPAFSMNANFVYTDATLKVSTTTDPVGRQLGKVPKRTAFVGASWQAAPDWRVYGEVRGVSEQWDDNLHAYRLPGYAVANMTLTYKMSKATDLYGSAVNLFNRTYVASGGFAPQMLGMPFAVTAGVRTQF